MILCDKVITVINARFNENLGYDTYVGTIIRGVSCYCETASTIDATGIKAANVFKIRIPTDADFSGKQYASPIVYAASDPSKFFTLAQGDLIVLGEVVAEQIKPSELQATLGQVVTVLGVTDNRRGRHGDHFKVVGK